MNQHWKAKWKEFRFNKRFILQNSRFLKIDHNDKLCGNKIYFVSFLETCYIK